MPHTSRERFFELLRREPDTIVSRQRAAELALQAGYTDWPGFSPAVPSAADRPRMAVVTPADPLPRVGGRRPSDSPLRIVAQS